MLERPESREVKWQFKTERYNVQVMRIRWGNISEDRRKKEWIMYSTQNNRHLGKVIRKKKKKVLIEHWQMQDRENELSTEISLCNGCTRNEEQNKEGCQQWLRIDSRVKMIPEVLIAKSSNKIKAAIDQLAEKVKTKNFNIKEQKLKGLKALEELEVEIVK